MNDINLLRYHNRSAHEIHMLLNGEMKDKFFSRVVLGEIKEGAGRTLLTPLLTVAASFVCAVFASYVIYHAVIVKDIYIPTIDKEMIKNKVAEYRLELRTGGDPYLKDGYTKIAAVETSTEAAAPSVVVVSEYEPPIDIESQPELFTKPVELTGEPEKRKRDKRNLITPILTGNFAIRFLDVNESDAVKVRTLAENNDFNINIIGSNKKSRVRWAAYRENPQSGTVIAGKNVTHLNTFSSRDAAVNYLQKRKIAGVVASRTTYYNYYDMEVCCLGEEAAEKLARGSGVSMSKVKIIKK